MSSSDDSGDMSEAWEPPTTTQRRKSNKKKLEPVEFSDDFESPLTKKPKRRTSARRKNQAKRKSLNNNKKPPMVNLASSDSDDIIINDNKNKNRRKSNGKSKPKQAPSIESTDSEQENIPIMANIESSSKPKSRKTSTTNNKMEIDTANDADDDLPISPKKKRGRKRKSMDAGLEEPPSKKIKLSTTNLKKKGTKKEVKKPGKLKGNEATERIKQFMMNENRPYSASEINKELLNTITVNQINKSLEELKEDGILVMREFGKKKKVQIYWRNQEEFNQDEDDDDNDDDEKMIQQIKELEIEIAAKSKRLNQIKTECKRLQNEPTDDEILLDMNRSTTQFNKLMEDLKLKESGPESQRVSQQDINKKLMEFYRFSKAWKDRKTVIYDAIGQIWQDSNDKPDKLLKDKIGGESDKDNDVDWSKYKEIFNIARRTWQQQKDKERKNKRR